MHRTAKSRQVLFSFCTAKPVHADALTRYKKRQGNRFLAKNDFFQIGLVPASYLALAFQALLAALFLVE